MKAALLSFHNAYNYGAALQAYALQKGLEEMGVQCEYINYINEQRDNMYNMRYQFKTALAMHNYSRAVRVLVGTPFINVRRRKFNKFFDRYLKKTDRVYHNSAEAQTLDDSYDKFVVGSDQVWNVENNGGDTAYLLDFVRPEKRISYSSSFGMNSVPEHLRERYSKQLSAFNRISVREDAGIKIIKELTGRDAHLVLDPVFLLRKEKWNQLRNVRQKNKEKFVFFYTNNDCQVKDFLSIGYPMSGMKSHILSSYVTPADFISPSTKVMVSMSPDTFLDEIASAEMIVTASFHCLAFAILFHKPFCVILTGNRGKDERLLNLLRITRLESRILTADTTVTQLQQPIDYELVDKRLEPYLAHSKEYLRRAVFSEVDVEKLQINDESQKYFCSDDRCSGCTACTAVCPVHAIQMKPDNEGFLVPVRDANVCIDCLKCHEVCQVFHKKTDTVSQSFYAVKNNDQIRRQSTSGGVFTALSDVVFDQQGVVVAASMEEGYQVKHIIIDSRELRDRVRGTYYVQSNLNDVFVLIADFLATGRKVLFVGTPCQVQGLRNYIGKNESLFLCDLVCHGAPSPRVFEKYVDYIRTRGELSEYRFRDKSQGWKNGYTVSAVFDGKKICNTLWLQSFLKMFSKNMINRRSCAGCPYASYDRPGDVTIGDFWGIQKKKPEIYDELGVSLVICNTKKGKTLLQATDGLMMVPVEQEITEQNSLLHSAAGSAARLQVFRMLEKCGYEKTAKTYGGQNVKGWIKERIRRLIV